MSLLQQKSNRANSQNLPKIFESINTMPSVLIRHTQKILGSLFAEECNSYGIEITQQQLEVLLIISIQSGLDQTTLARSLGIDPSTITVLIDNLSKRKLVERTQAKDRRKNSLQLTKSAAPLLEKGWMAVRDSTEKLLLRLESKDAKQLIDTLIEAASQQNSSAPLWVPMSVDNSGSSTEQEVSQLKELYRMPAFLLDRCIQIDSANLNDVIATFGLSSGQAGTLFIVAMMGPMDLETIRHVQGVGRSSISVIVPALLKLELISKEKDTVDKRRTLLSSTEKGRAQILEANFFVNGAIDKCFEGLQPDTKKRLCKLLSQLLVSQNFSFLGALRSPL